MAQARHSSEITLSIDDTKVSQAIERLNKGFKGLQQGAQSAVAQRAGAVAQAAMRADDFLTGGAGRELAAAGYYAGSGVYTAASAAVNSSAMQSAVGTLPIVGQALRGVLGARQRRSQQAQGLEPLIAELTQGIGTGAAQIVGAREEGAEFGYAPAQSLQLMRSFARARQMRGGASRSLMGQLFAAERMGISSAVIGQFAAGGALGGGAEGGVGSETQMALRLAGAARGMGLSGSGVERFLASIAQATQSMAQQGLSIDTESLGAFVTAVSDVAKDAGVKQVQGVGAMRATQRLLGMSGGALGSFRGQFGDIGQGILQSVAARGAGSPLEMIQKLEKFATSPNEALKALREAGVSDELIELALVGSGASTDEAMTLMGVGEAPKLRSRGLGAQVGGIKEQLTLSAAQAGIDQRLISLVEENKKASVNMMEIAATFEELALNMTKQNTVLTDSLEGIRILLEGAPEKIEEIKKILSDIPGAIKKAIMG